MGAPLFDPASRRSERVALDGVISLRRPGQLGYRVRLFDVSCHGCRVEFVERPNVDEPLWIRFEGLQPIEAEVCWIDGFLAGVNFVSPIHPAVFDSLLRRLR
jgi:hypothetical protein